jgi:VIT1/CCC1 family predicted Fe2+/Mn2+ transporter
LIVSIVVTLIVLTSFGYIKGHSGASPVRSTLRTMLIGGLVSAVAFLIVQALPHEKIEWAIMAEKTAIRDQRT